jgi:mono/diheme cytochrome c family protein
MPLWRAVVVWLLACAPIFSADPPKVDFAHNVAPILKARCVECHGNGLRKGEFNLDTREGLLASKGVVTLGKPAESELLKRVTHQDPDSRMPPKGEALTAKQIETLTRWIEAGAPWEAGFSFAGVKYNAPLKPREVSLPAASSPARSHPLDRLLDAQLAKTKTVTPNPADDATFLRRVTLDLVGTLPTPDAVRAFTAESNPEKYARVVDHLLADNQAYTEHWLTFWNDLLRNDYSGTGFIDGGRKPITVWLYNALRTNKPYDQFARELIVPSLESEGFTKGIKWRGAVNASQVVELQFAQNVGQVFLGVNLKCASCHDSFIDTWKLTDAYGLAAVIADKPLEIHRCDKPQGQFAKPSFPFRELGTVDETLNKQGRLKRVAELLTHPDNGRFTRTVVNRYWHRLMGRGLVEPVDIMGGEPWNADVLDWLAVDFAKNKYDLKHLIRTITTSHAYRAKSVPPTPEGQPFVYAGPVSKRMTAEQFVDALWMITGTGPKQPHASFKSIPRQGSTVRASMVDADLLMRALGRPNREHVVTTRPDDLSTLQALDLTNGSILTNAVNAGAKALRTTKRSVTVEDVYLRMLSRMPSAAETAATKAILGDSPTDESWADLLWAMFMHPEFQVVK